MVQVVPIQATNIFKCLPYNVIKIHNKLNIDSFNNLYTDLKTLSILNAILYNFKLHVQSALQCKIAHLQKLPSDL